MAWATEQEITQTSPQSHLLLILASFANEQNECYPSIKTMSNKTRLNEKTVRKCIGELIELGLLSDTKKVSNFGAKIYSLNLNFNTDLDKKSDADNDEKNPIPPTKNGSTTNFGGVPNLGVPPYQNWEYPPTKNGSTPLPNLPPNPVINHKDNHKDNSKHEHTQKNSQNSSDEQSDKPTKKTSSRKRATANKFITADVLVDLGVDSQVAQDYLATRKTKFTQTALNGISKQAQLAGISLGEALEFVCEMGWQSFKADWYNNAQQKYQTQGASHGTHSTRNHQSDAQAYAQELHRQYQEYYGNTETESDAGSHVARNVYDVEGELWF